MANAFGDYIQAQDEVVVESRTFVKACASTNQSPERKTSVSNIFGSSYYKGNIITKSPHAAASTYADIFKN